MTVIHLVRELGFLIPDRMNNHIQNWQASKIEEQIVTAVFFQGPGLVWSSDIKPVRCTPMICCIAKVKVESRVRHPVWSNDVFGFPLLGVGQVGGT